MKVFVTGATGFIGEATVKELLSNGHQVLGLARSDANAEVLQKLGAEVQRGDLENTAALKDGAAASDGAIHLGFVHDFANFEHVCAIDRSAISAMAEGLGDGSGKPLVIAAGTLGVVKGSVATEETEDDLTMGPLSARAKSSELIRQLSKEKGIHGMVIRLTPSVHGQGDKGFVTMIGDTSKKIGTSLYVNEKNPSWPAVHRLDAAVLLRLALEKGKPGKTYHAIAEQEVSLKNLAELIGKKLDLPVQGASFAEAQQKLGFFAFVISQENPASGEATQKELGWKPTQPGLLADVEANYF